MNTSFHAREGNSVTCVATLSLGMVIPRVAIQKLALRSTLALGNSGFLKKKPQSRRT
jgi:hypothetical protein